ncbi:hypothetical protein HL658_34110 [Azospirillum sp. RWY-5-1]|uniref:VCBS repeat-containing protein n=1 Tax=Azospirillum oleiclasticum TaxID=2735135 RepID=A0ABX2TKN6_9PROT|nr:hypothetical protein [Azospirillum oleiclasticum]NYZ17606.1 hypothetical protein [Azospirillum oleiclasticum]NYZ24926.1 hypothetical protein [Azospirillum oleiclasticum]
MRSVLRLAMAVAGLLTGTPAGAMPAQPWIASATGDIDGDGVPDRAALSGDGDSVSLSVFLSGTAREPAGPVGPADVAPTIHRDGLGWMGDMEGQRPEIAVTARGSLTVVFQNEAIGRNRWRETLTIAHRGGVLVVAGYTHESRDTLAPDASSRCDVNLLTGKGEKNGTPFTVPARRVPVTEWTDAAVPQPCRP